MAERGIMIVRHAIPCMPGGLGMAQIEDLPAAFEATKVIIEVPLHAALLLGIRRPFLRTYVNLIANTVSTSVP